MIQAMCLAMALASLSASPSEFDKTTHWNTDLSGDIFKIGAFTEADKQGWPAGWQDASAFATGQGELRTAGGGKLVLTAADNGREVAIRTTLDLPPKTEHVTFLVRLRGPEIERGDTPVSGGGVTFSFLNAKGRQRDVRRVDPSYKGYRNWISRLQTARVLPGETRLRVSITLFDSTGDLEVDKILIVPSSAADEPTDEQSKALTTALNDDDAAAIAQLIKDDPKMLEMRTGGADNGTPLIRAAWSGSANVAEKLIELGADIEAKDYNWGNTPMRWCSWWGTHEVTALLINAGAETRGASQMAQNAKTSNRSAKRPKEDFDLVSKLVDEYEAKKKKTPTAR